MVRTLRVGESGLCRNDDANSLQQQRMCFSHNIFFRQKLLYYYFTSVPSIFLAVSSQKEDIIRVVIEAFDNVNCCTDERQVSTKGLLDLNNVLLVRRRRSLEGVQKFRENITGRLKPEPTYCAQTRNIRQSREEGFNRCSATYSVS